MSDKKLTKKQQKFVDVYNGNATEAARLAGYKGNDVTLGQVGAENLKKPQILEAIQNREPSKEDKGLERKIKSKQDLQKFWEEALLNKSTIMITLRSGDEVEVQEVGWKERLKASELLGKSMAAFTEKIEHSGPDGGPITTGAITPDMDVKEAAKIYSQIVREGKK